MRCRQGCREEKRREEAISCEERNSTGMTFTSVARNPSGPFHIQRYAHMHTHKHKFILDCLLKTIHPEMHIRPFPPWMEKERCVETYKFMGAVDSSQENKMMACH